MISYNCRKNKDFLMVLERRGEILSDYNRWLKSYLRNSKHREVSENSMIIYRRVLNHLTKYIEEQDEIDRLREVDTEFILSFLEYLEDNSKSGKFSTKTKVLYISVLKSFFGYISDNNNEFYTYENEFKGIMPKKKNRGKKITYLNDSEVESILLYLNEKINSSKRHYEYIYALAIKLMLFSGLRVSEVLGLCLEDIRVSDLVDKNGERDFYEVHLKETKSNEEQMALIKIEHIEAEIAYFREFRRDDEPIFKGKKSKNIINRSNFYVSVNNIMKKLEIRSRGLHIFRHTCAMQLFRKTGNLLVLKETLRHSDIKTTMIYAHAEKRDIADAMR
jgi:integrase/recombinase XerD